MYHAKMQLKILKHSLVNISKHAKEELGLPRDAPITIEVEEVMYRTIIECVEHHKAIIK